LDGQAGKQGFNREMDMRIGGIVLAAALTMATSVSTAQEYGANLIKEGTITTGTSGSAPPFSMTTADGTLEGFDIDVMTAVGEALGLEVEFKQLDFAGLLPGLSAGRFDVISSGVTRTPERLASEDFFLLSPYIVNGVAITRRADDDSISGWDSVCGKIMGSVRGGTFQTLAQQNLPDGCITESREYPGSTELFLDLTNRRIDFAAHDFLGPNYLLNTGRLSDVVVLDDLLGIITQSVAVATANEPLAEAIDGLFATWRDDGTLQALADDWFGASIDWSAAQQ
jgi:ABC-type amino acid transport substrate-binding protein